jgi:hypothetical protein
MNDAPRRLRAIAILAVDILAGGASADDERTSPELRDIVRLAHGQGARTRTGKAAWNAARDDDRRGAA